MKASILNKLDGLQDRYEELTAQLSDGEVINDQERYRAYSREYAELQPVIQSYAAYQQTLSSIESARELLKEDDADMRDMAQDEIRDGEAERDRLAIELQQLLLPKDLNDNRNIFLEVRAGTGGDEAAIFAGDLFRMYSRYAENRGWQVELINERPGEHGGYKEVVARIVGNNVYANLKFESGAHRVQRVPATEAQGRIHTSACTVAVLPEVEGVESIEINRADLRIDTFRASGAGGQHVNKTDSAIRLTHLPTGVVVECQDERSQHKNRARAMSLLQAKLLSAAQDKQHETQAAERKLQVGSGDRSERIRTYNFPQGRLTDHRINLTLYQLDDVVNGNLDPVIQPLLQEYQAEQLAELANG